eukprot:9798107-Heterocapsa_arctica.AAC.1
MCADIYTKAFTDAILWVQVCDLINIADPKRLAGLMQHVAELVAGLDVVDIPTNSSGKGPGASDSIDAPKGTTAPPPRGGFPNTSVLVIALVPLKGLSELPLPCAGMLPTS